MITFHETPELDRPVLVSAFQGWSDGGTASTTALNHVMGLWGATKFASIDSEEFYDFQVNRPLVTLTEGTVRQIEWPSNDLFHAKHRGRDFVLLLGVEPNLKWKSFVGGIVNFGKEIDVQMFVSMGSFLADIPHTRVPPVTGVSSDSTLAGRLGLQPSHYQGPTGITGVLTTFASQAGFPTASLWTGAPHYLGPSPNPRAARALIEKLSVLLEFPIATDLLKEAETTWEAQVTEAIESSPELRDYVERLEQAYAENEDLAPMPSGDEIAEELERYLRDQGT